MVRILYIGFITLSLSYTTLYAQDPSMVDISALLAKDTVTILVTDSGLGGLAVAADVEHRVRSSRIYPRVKVIFANALAEKNYGYNSMTTREEKIRVFSAALSGMSSWYRPDIILIACNTLSVLYAETDFARTAAIPVVGIVSMGVDLMAERLRANPTAVALIMGTPTTITAGKHREGLLALGIAPERIITQACRNLESEIQSDPQGGTVRSMVDTYVAEALAARTDTTQQVVVGLCCTHYGYSRAIFESTMTVHAGVSSVVIDPNSRMADFLFPPKLAGSVPASACSVGVVSRTVVTPEEMDALGGLLEGVSPATAAALRAFVHKRDLFEFTPRPH